MDHKHSSGSQQPYPWNPNEHYFREKLTKELLLIDGLRKRLIYNRTRQNDLNDWLLSNDQVLFMEQWTNYFCMHFKKDYSWWWGNSEQKGIKQRLGQSQINFMSWKFHNLKGCLLYASSIVFKTTHHVRQSYIITEIGPVMPHIYCVATPPTLLVIHLSSLLLLSRFSSLQPDNAHFLSVIHQLYSQNHLKSCVPSHISIFSVLNFIHSPYFTNLHTLSISVGTKEE